VAQSLKQAILGQSNDYSTQEQQFQRKTGLQLVTADGQNESGVICHKLMSVIIPCYDDDLTLPLLVERLNHQTNRNFEVIIVDDGSAGDTLSIVKQSKPNFKLRFIRQHKNFGLPFTRNTGILMAEGDSLIFVDSDIIFDRDFIQRFAVRCESTDACAFIGFRQQIKSKDLAHDNIASYRADWRHEVEATTDFLTTHPRKLDSSDILRKYRLLEESNYLKKLGNGTAIGFWDLASMVIGHGICVSRASVLAVGGFPEKGFRGWGAEDIAFGALLIANGNYIVPVLNNAYFHVVHPPRSGSFATQRAELTLNLQQYFELLEAPSRPIPIAKRRIAKAGEADGIETFEVTNVE
jgi:glycosyltransferase involved in cell wall biosynthesis